MAIWCLFTQCLSEPTFHGYVNSKKQAIEWVELEADDRKIGTTDMDVKDEHIILYDGDATSIEAVKLEKFE